MKEKNRESFDEMQKERRNRVGHQMFHFLFWSIVLLTALDSIDLWSLNFHRDISTIVGVSMIIYIGRLFALSSFIPASWNTRRNQIIHVILFIVGFALVFTIVLVLELSAGPIMIICFAIIILGVVLLFIGKKIK